MSEDILPWYVDVPPIRRWLSEMIKKGEEQQALAKISDWRKMVDEYGVVKTSKQGKVGRIELSYPIKGNALVPAMYKMLVKAIEDMEEDEDVWVIVLTGSGKNFSTGGYVGPDAFYAGLDAGGHGTKAEPMRRTFVEMFQKINVALYECEKPTIAMLNGFSAGEAVDLALAADIRTGHADSDLWFSYARTGNTAYCGGAWLLSRMVGLAQAKRIIFTADRVSGTRAHELGLITDLFTRETLEAETMALAERIAALAPITLRLLKKELHRGLEVNSFVSNLDIVSMIEPIVQFTEDHMDAEDAIVEKRPPVVRGR